MNWVQLQSALLWPWVVGFPLAFSIVAAHRFRTGGRIALSRARTWGLAALAAAGLAAWLSDPGRETAIPLANIVFFIVADGVPIIVAANAARNRALGWPRQRPALAPTALHMAAVAYTLLPLSVYVAAHAWHLAFRLTGGAL
ncbi:MAG: hypothetical protein NVS4B3_01830 [Gemmatimonadaceae bacterium]